MRRRRRHVAAVLALGLVATALASPTAAVGRDTTVPPSSGRPSSVPTPGTAGDTAVAAEDAEDWCSYLTSSYLAFPSPWTARLVNCTDTDLLVAPLRTDGSVGACVLVPARHSRHLGGDLLHWVTDTRAC